MRGAEGIIVYSPQQLLQLRTPDGRLAWHGLLAHINARQCQTCLRAYAATAYCKPCATPMAHISSAERSRFATSDMYEVPRVIVSNPSSVRDSTQKFILAPKALHHRRPVAVARIMARYPFFLKVVATTSSSVSTDPVLTARPDGGSPFALKTTPPFHSTFTAPCSSTANRFSSSERLAAPIIQASCLHGARPSFGSSSLVTLSHQTR